MHISRFHPPGGLVSLLLAWYGSKCVIGCNSLSVGQNRGTKRMNTDILKIFVVLSELSSYTKTAQHFDISQSTVSKKIAELESEVGTRLLVREKKGTYLTGKGKAFLEYAQRILSLENEAVNAVSENNGLEQVSLGSVTSLIPIYAGELAAGFRQQHPQYSLKILDDCSGELLKLLSDNSVDACLSLYNFKDKNYTCKVCFEDEIILAAPKELPIPSFELSEQELLSLPLIQDDLTLMADRRWFERLFSLAKQITVHISTGFFVLPLIKKGIGCGFVFKRQAQPLLDSGDIMELKIAERPPMIIKTYLIYKNSIQTESKRLLIQYIESITKNQ